MTEPRNPAPPDDSAFGVLRIKAGPGGGAVRLATLVRDLMDRHQMARAEAVRAHLLPPLIVPNAPTLYLLQPGGNALPLGDREWFDTPDGNPGKKPQAGRVVRSRGIGYAPTNIPMADSVGRGLVGALSWLNRVWGNPAYADAVCMDALYLSAVASRLAVSELDAAEVWGWGSAKKVVALAPAPKLTDWQRLIADRNSADRFLWTPERALVIHNEEARRKSVPDAKGVRKEMAAEMSKGGKPITHQKLFEAMRSHLINQASGRRQG